MTLSIIKKALYVRVDRIVQNPLIPISYWKLYEKWKEGDKEGKILGRHFMRHFIFNKKGSSKEKISVMYDNDF